MEHYGMMRSILYLSFLDFIDISTEYLFIKHKRNLVKHYINVRSSLLQGLCTVVYL